MLPIGSRETAVQLPKGLAGDFREHVASQDEKGVQHGYVVERWVLRGS